MDTDVLVIGGGAAGLAAAVRLRSRAPAVQVALVNPTPYNVYRPWLIYALPHLIAPEDLRLPLPELADRYGFTFHQGTVERLEPASRVALGAGEPIRYRRVVVAAGAPTDPGAIPGADRHAVFPCDLAGLEALQRRIDAGTGVATVVVTGERIGPGLEQAAWLARAGHDRGSPRARVRLVADGDCVADQFGARATARIERQLRSWGAEVELGSRVAAIEADAVRLADGRRLPSTVTALVGALRGPDLDTDGLADEHGFLPANRALQSLHEPTVFVAGDALAHGPRPLRKNWQLSVRQGRTAAENALRSLSGAALADLDDARDRRVTGFSLPDLGGTGYLVFNRRLIAAGRPALRIRVGFDRQHFAAYQPEDTRWQRMPR